MTMPVPVETSMSPLIVVLINFNSFKVFFLFFFNDHLALKTHAVSNIDKFLVVNPFVNIIVLGVFNAQHPACGVFHVCNYRNFW